MDQNKQQFQIPTSVLEDIPTQVSSELAQPVSPETVHVAPDEIYPQEASYTPVENDPILARRFFGVVSSLEHMPDPRLTGLQTIANEFESYRASATEDNLTKTALQVVLDLLKTTPESLEERLANEESLHGGKVLLRPPFTKYYPKDEKDERKLKKEMGIDSLRFWYLNEYFYYEVKHVGQEPLVIAYHATQEGVYKSIDGKPVPMIPGELDSLYAAAGLACEEVGKKMYPVTSLVDNALADLTTGDDGQNEISDYLDSLKR